jgi:hypothetical protein
MRTYLIDCPDQSSRAFTVKIFVAAIRSALTWPQERNDLELWSCKWEEEVQVWQALTKSSPIEYRCAPCCLERRESNYENIDRLGDSGISSLGIIISYLNVLIEVIPRCWRFRSETFSLTRHLAWVSIEKSYILRRPMVVALIPARLVALVAREQLQPSHYRLYFPGASMSNDIANIQARTEAYPSAVSIRGNPNHTNDSSCNRGPCTADFTRVLETLASLGNLPGVVGATLFHEMGDMARGRRRYALTEPTTHALSIIFHEYCAPGAPGMGQREIEKYLIRCAVDTSQLSPQRIMDMIMKYPAEMEGAYGIACMSLEGLLAYYRDAIQNNDLRLRSDLDNFGFRPDLSRRSRSAQFIRIADRSHVCRLAESIAFDVAESLGNSPTTFGPLADVALNETLPIYLLALSCSDSLGMYLLAGANYLTDSTEIINRLLTAIRHAPHDWSGTEQVRNMTAALEVLASIPDRMQTIRINLIMESEYKPSRDADHGAGLLPILRLVDQYRQSVRYGYTNEIHWTLNRYIDILKQLKNSYRVCQWMIEHKDACPWDFLEPDLHENYRQTPQQAQHIRSDYVSRDDAGAYDGHSNMNDRIAIHADLLPTIQQSDQFDNSAMNESEDEEDSQFDRVSEGPLLPKFNDGPFEIIVSGAGSENVNGIYHQDGYFNNTCRYCMDAEWGDSIRRFHIFQCAVSDNRMHWFISVVPTGSQPGTNSDIDFYAAPVTESSRTVPPREGWQKAAHEGLDPAPVIHHSFKHDERGSPEETWSDSVQPDEEEDGRNPAELSEAYI